VVVAAKLQKAVRQVQLPYDSRARAGVESWPVETVAPGQATQLVESKAPVVAREAVDRQQVVRAAIGQELVVAREETDQQQVVAREAID
jgi:hypothetical protein